MTALRFRGTAVAAVLLALVLAGCADGDAGAPDEAVQTEPADAAAPAPDAPSSPDAPPTGDLASVLLEVSEIPLAGWVAEPPSDDDPTVDDETGGVCTFDLTEVLTAEQQATERGVSFSNEAQMTLLQEYVWAVPSADEVLASVSAQLGTCSGAYEGTSGDSTVSITSQPLELTMPGVTTSVCRLFSAVISGQGPLPGAICLGTSGDRLLGVMVTSFDPAVATTQEEYVALMTAATGKAFA